MASCVANELSRNMARATDVHAAAAPRASLWAHAVRRPPPRHVPCPAAAARRTTPVRWHATRAMRMGRAVSVHAKQNDADDKDVMYDAAYSASAETIQPLVMAEELDAATEEATEQGLKLPSAYAILFALICVVAAATWVVPAGAFTRELSEALGKQVAVPGTYHLVPSVPQGLVAIFLAPVRGLYATVDVAAFLFCIGGFLQVVNVTGAIDAGIGRVVAALRGREIWMIPILMTLFALGGTSWGLAEETIPFYGILIPVMLTAGYDALTAVATVLVGAGVGVLGSTVNPFATVIASDAAAVPFTAGLPARVVLLVGATVVAAQHVMQYAAAVKSEPSTSHVAHLMPEHRTHFLSGRADGAATVLSGQQQATLLQFVGFFAVMIWGVAVAGWEMSHMSALFIAGAACVGLTNSMSEERFTSTFLDGARDMLGVAILIGLARGIVLVMTDGMITDTLLQWMAQGLQGLPATLFINIAFAVEGALTFLVPSTSGLAALTMPVLAPLADFAGVSRELLVTAYQCGTGLVNLVAPTSGVVMGALALGRIPFTAYLRFMAPLLAKLALLCVGVLVAGVALAR